MWSAFAKLWLLGRCESLDVITVTGSLDPVHTVCKGKKHDEHAVIGKKTNQQRVGVVQPEVDYFSITACPKLLYFSYTTAAVNDCNVD